MKRGLAEGRKGKWSANASRVPGKPLAGVPALAINTDLNRPTVG
jgi:hypothetical protein